MSGTTEAYRWAISYALKEAAFGTTISPASLTKWLEIKAAEFAQLQREYRTNQNYINGVRGMSNYQLHLVKGMMKREFDASSEVLGWSLPMQLGNLATAGSGDPYTHTVKSPTVCSLYMPSFSFIEGIVCAGLTQTQKGYKGCVINKQDINIVGKGPIGHSIEILHDGSESDQSAVTMPSAVEALTYLLGEHCTFKLNPYAGSDIDITSQVQSCKVSISSNAQVVKTINSGVYVPRYKYAKNSPKYDIELVVSADKSDVIYGYWTGDTQLKFQLLIDPGVTPLRSINPIVAQCYIASCEATSDDIEPTLKLKIDSLDVIANAGPCIWTNKTGQSAYLT